MLQQQQRASNSRPTIPSRTNSTEPTAIAVLENVKDFLKMQHNIDAIDESNFNYKERCKKTSKKDHFSKNSENFDTVCIKLQIKVN